MNYRTAWFLDGVGALAMLAAMALVPSDAAARSVRQELHPTGVAQASRCLDWVQTLGRFSSSSASATHRLRPPTVAG